MGKYKVYISKDKIYFDIPVQRQPWFSKSCTEKEVIAKYVIFQNKILKEQACFQVHFVLVRA